MSIQEALDLADEETINDILTEAYSELLAVYNNDVDNQEIVNLTLDEANNSIEWIDEVFIKHFESREEYEKCEFLNLLSNQIKTIKKLKK